MADTAVVNITWDDDDGTDVAAGQGTAIVHANTHVITPTGPLEEMIIMVTNTEGSTNAVTVLAGDNPPAESAGLGAKTFTTIAATTGRIILPPLESARFLQNDGTVRITVEANMTGFIMALQRPHVSACT
jgi:hypothetical protein